MQVNTRKYGGDAMRSYKALMRKLNREGFYQELRDREHYRSKSERRREDKIRGILRTQKKQKIRQEQLERESSYKKTKSTKQKV